MAKKPKHKQQKQYCKNSGKTLKMVHILKKSHINGIIQYVAFGKKRFLKEAYLKSYVCNYPYPDT